MFLYIIIANNDVFYYKMMEINLYHKLEIYINTIYNDIEKYSYEGDYDERI